jgi:hypothetical protein
MSPQDYFNLFASVSGLPQQQQQAAGQPGQQAAPLAFLGQQQPQQGQPQQGQPQQGQQGGNAYAQMGGMIGGGLRGLLSPLGANGSSNTLADAVGFQPFGGGGWGSGS